VLPGGLKDSRSQLGQQGTRALRAPNEYSPRTCTAGTVVLTSARCSESLAEADTALLKQYRSKEG